MDMAEFFDLHAAGWDDGYKEYDPVRYSAAALSGINEKSRVLDIACGTGVMFNEYLKLKASKIVGIDLSEKMISIARKKFADKKNISLICSDFMDFNAGKFDTAVMFNAYPHFLDKKKMIRHVAELLTDGGRFTVVHDMGREHLNYHHKNMQQDLWTELLPAAEEAEQFSEWFDIDMICDTSYFYMISGIIKKSHE